MEEQPDDRPVAYDAEGRPLYYHPESASEPAPSQTPPPAAPETTAAPEPTSLPGIEQAPASEPETKPPELEQKHGESVANYPELDVGPNEFVVID